MCQPIQLHRESAAHSIFVFFHVTISRFSLAVASSVHFISKMLLISFDARHENHWKKMLVLKKKMLCRHFLSTSHHFCMAAPSAQI